MTSRLIEAFEQFLNDDGTPIADGQLRFLVAGSTGTSAYQDTFSDINLSNPNPNPLPIQATGRIPAVWVPDLYYRIRYEHTDGTLIKEVDYVGSPETQGQWGAWNNETVYTIDKIVYYSGKFYRSNTGGNQDNQPDISSEWSELDVPEKYSNTVNFGLHNLAYENGILYVSMQPDNLNHAPSTSHAWWQRVNNIPHWGSTATYRNYDLAIDSNGVVVVSQQNNNLNHNPVGDSGTWWLPFWQTIPPIAGVKYLSGGGALTARFNNSLTDAGAYTFPPANSVPANTPLILSISDTYSAFQPTATASGSDLILRKTGTYNTFQFRSSAKRSYTFISNGTDRWVI